ncbi:MAG: DUF3127 domain-containing protein [Microscillaceae bacterium]
MRQRIRDFIEGFYIFELLNDKEKNMALEVNGKLVKSLPEVGGTSKAGNNWRKQDFVIETMDQYPKKICFSLWGDKIDMLREVREGEQLKVSFDVESREYNERWYTDLKAWRIEKVGAQDPGSEGMTPAQDPFPDEFMNNASDADLPF